MNYFTKIVLLCLPVCAFATLGQNFASITQDAAQLSSVESTTVAYPQMLPVESGDANSNAVYSVYQIKASNGNEVRQYIANDKVFAVVWQGESAPNLNQLFGKYYYVYESSPRKYKSSTLESIQGQDFISYSGRAMGKFYGKAIVPSLIPDGVSMIKIK